MPQRRFHTKTRSGCEGCKGRKTKCDEARPSCNKCIKRGANCSFSNGDPPLVILSTMNPRHAHRIRSDGCCQDLVSNPNSRIHSQKAFSESERDGLRLMYHYTLKTCLSISDSPEMIIIWRDRVPLLAFEHDFLLHGLLAVTSLHLALISTADQNSHTSIALSHYTAGLALFRKQLNAITPANVSALFGFSCLVPLYSFGIYHTACPAPDPLIEVCKIFSLLRGVAVIVKNCHHWLEQGIFKDTMSLLPKPTDSFKALPADIENALISLGERNREATGDEALRETYATSIWMVRYSFLLMCEQPGKKMVILPFPIMIPAEFITQTQKGAPMALVILAHYSVVLFSLREHLWLAGWGRELITAVQEAVGQEWQECIAWATKSLEIEAD